jgi:hypothetical protein
MLMDLPEFHPAYKAGLEDVRFDFLDDTEMESKVDTPQDVIRQSMLLDVASFNESLDMHCGGSYLGRPKATSFFNSGVMLITESGSNRCVVRLDESGRERAEQ